MAMPVYNERDDERLHELEYAKATARSKLAASAISWALQEIEELRTQRDDAIRQLNAIKR